MPQAFDRYCFPVVGAREKRKRKKRSFARFVFKLCSFRFCDYTKNNSEMVVVLLSLDTP